MTPKHGCLPPLARRDLVERMHAILNLPLRSRTGWVMAVGLVCVSVQGVDDYESVTSPVVSL